MKQCAIMYINMEYIFSCKYEICFIRIVRGIDIFWEAICLQFCAFFYNKKKKEKEYASTLVFIYWGITSKYPVSHTTEKIKTSVNYYTQQYLCMDGIICLMTPGCGEDRNL